MKPLRRRFRGLLPPFLVLTVALGAALATPVTSIAASPEAATVVADPIATGLTDPVGFTFAPDGRIFYGERTTGELRILSADGLTDSPFFTIDEFVVEQNQGIQGLLSVTLHPDYPATPYVYAYVSRMRAGLARNQIVRITDDAGVGEDLQVIFESSAPAGDQHNGGRLLFGPDGMLYAWIGDHRQEQRVQDLSKDNGKILRMNPDGSPAAGNPFGTRVWSYGHRNGIGLAFDPIDGRLWQTENGPACNDEINRIRKGRNFGWGPHEDCKVGRSPGNTNRDGPKIVMPELFLRTTIGITGAAFCDACGLGGGRDGHLIYAGVNFGKLYEATLNGDRTGITGHKVLLAHGSPTLGVEVAPDGTLAFSDPTGIYRLTVP